MFRDCKSLTKIDFSLWNKVTIHYISNMFVNCKSLETVNLTSLITEKGYENSGFFSVFMGADSI